MLRTPMHRLLLSLEHGFISTGLEPGDAQGSHFYPFRRAGAAEGMGLASSKISVLKSGANENQKVACGL